MMSNYIALNWVVRSECCTQLQRKVLCPKVSIPLKHPQVFVSCDRSHLHHIQTLLKEPASGLVSQVMKPKITDPSP